MIEVRARPSMLDGRGPVVPNGPQSARRLMATAPMSEGFMGIYVDNVASDHNAEIGSARRLSPKGSASDPS